MKKTIITFAILIFSVLLISKNSTFRSGNAGAGKVYGATCGADEVETCSTVCTGGECIGPYSEPCYDSCCSTDICGDCVGCASTCDGCRGGETPLVCKPVCSCGPIPPVPIDGPVIAPHDDPPYISPNISPTPCPPCIKKHCDCVEFMPKENTSAISSGYDKKLAFTCLVKTHIGGRVKDYSVSFQSPGGKISVLKSANTAPASCPAGTTANYNCYNVETTELKIDEAGTYNMIVPPVVSCE